LCQCEVFYVKKANFLIQNLPELLHLQMTLLSLPNNFHKNAPPSLLKFQEKKENFRRSFIAPAWWLPARGGGGGVPEVETTPFQKIFSFFKTPFVSYTQIRSYFSQKLTHMA